MILVVNAGSSSIKYKLFEHKSDKLFLINEGAYSDIGGNGPDSHREVSNFVINTLIHYSDKIKKIGYRVVQCGDRVSNGAKITPKVIKIISEYSDIAPLHNPKVLETIKTFQKRLSKADHLAYFDTNFFRELKSEERILPISEKIAKEYNIRKFGFHGISHKYAFEQSKIGKSKKVISLHLGAGSSVAAIRDGKPIATSFGFTPNSGLTMQSRAGDIDPGLVLYIAKKIGVEKAKELFEKKSGLAGVTGTNGEMLDILYLAGKKIEDKNYVPKNIVKNKESMRLAKIALRVYIESIRKFISYFFVLLEGCDVLIFTGKIGFGSTVIREMILDSISILKIKSVRIIEPDEEKAIAEMLIK